MTSPIFLVERRWCGSYGETNEALRAFRSLYAAQNFVRQCKRAGATRWTAHDAHGNSWTSEDGEYVIVEINLYADELTL